MWSILTLSSGAMWVLWNAHSDVDSAIRSGNVLKVYAGYDDGDPEMPFFIESYHREPSLSLDPSLSTDRTYNMAYASQDPMLELV